MSALLLLSLFGCPSPPNPALAAQALADDHLEAAVEHLPADLRARWNAVDGARTTLRTAEHEHLMAASEQLLSDGDWSRATVTISSGIGLGGSDFALLETQLLAAVSAQEDVGIAANTWVSLSEAHHLDVAFHQRAQREARSRLDQGLVDGRYQTEAQPTTLAGFEGVSVPMLTAVLHQIDTHYRVEPPWKALGEAGAQRLARIALHPDVQTAVPDLSALTRAIDDRSATTTQDQLERQGRALVAAGVAAGLPEQMLVAEWSEAVVGSLDPWSSVVWPAALTGWQIHHSGVEVGVGLEVAMFDKYVMVTLPDPDGPAWTAGLKQGDIVLQVDGERTLGWPIEDRLSMTQAALRGEPDSVATLQVLRAEEAQVIDVPRRPVQERTVYGLRTDQDNQADLWLNAETHLAYARITAFRPHTDESLASLLRDRADGLTGLVLDLRGNGGGDVQAAANVVDLFVADGIVGSLSGRKLAPPEPAVDEQGNAMADWNQALPGDPWEALPLVVLVDSQTASAAELVATALQDRAGAWVLGQKTFGKGWSQGLFSDDTLGFAMQLTNAEWRASNGDVIHRAPGSTDWGVTPDLHWTASAAERWQRTQQQRVAVFPKVHADGSPMVVTPIDSALPLLPEDPLLVIAEMALWSRQTSASR